MHRSRTSVALAVTVAALAVHGAWIAPIDAAIHSPTSFVLTVQRRGPGSVSSRPSGIRCGTDCTEEYPAGTIVELTAKPRPGATFLGWTGACTGTDECIVPMDGSRSVIAHFADG